MDWTFSAVFGNNELVSDLLEFYGYLLFLSPLVAAIPGLIFKAGEKFTGSKAKGDLYGLIIIMAFSCVAGCISSGQMCHQAKSLDDTANAIAFVIIFFVYKTVHYGTPAVVSRS